MKNMKKKLPGLAALFFFLLVGVDNASAQSRFGIYLATEVGEANTIAGLEGRIGSDSSAIRFAPSFEISVAGGGSRWQANGNLLYVFGIPESFLRPYTGGGVSVVQHDEGDDTDLGFNLLGGVQLYLGQIQPYANARLTVAGEADLAFIVGLLIRTR